ncbi:MAG: bifunctional folylpolyglutamate synthase/dihydrofolate synthase [Hyphomicrobiales bacterium]|nr:bifunctional folylpolyglutamate synthase/dihydrofolate synthase [Hyphomicrobiales bacterium]
MKTDALIEHLSQFHPKGYDLSLGRISELLAKLGNPQKHLPPVFHVAGTNGKGSVIANLRAILEAGNYSVHAHTSPHLVDYHERYRIGHDKNEGVAKSRLVSDDMLAEALGRVADANDGDRITVFELLAATMFVLFSEQPADYSIVEVGLGGRFDGTNVIDKPLVSIITTISLDHQAHLGNTIGEIAFEKAGIIKPGCAVIIGNQPDEVREVLENIANEKKCPMMIAGQDFDYYEEAGRFIYQDVDGLLDLPLPNLRGEHQLANSATAIAATRLANCGIDEFAYENAMRGIYWPGRFEQLKPGKITSGFAEEMEIWIDGGHNVGAGEAISFELKSLNDARPKNLIVICAMLNTKNPQQYFAQFAALKPRIFTVPITTSEHGIPAQDLVRFARDAGMEATACEHLDVALFQAGEINGDSRLLIAGSLYLVGEVLKKNGTLPE